MARGLARCGMHFGSYITLWHHRPPPSVFGILEGGLLLKPTVSLLVTV